MAKTRVHELAKEFGVESKFVLDFMKSRGEFVKSASSTIEPPVELRIKRELLAELSAPLEHPGEPTAEPRITFDDLEQGLRGSPYSLPTEQREYIDSTFVPLTATLATRVERSRSRLNPTGERQLRRANRTQEIFQSNRIEDLGPDLATTDRILNEQRLQEHDPSSEGRLDEVSFAVAEDAIRRCIDAEPKVRDVVGLGAAKLLAEQFLSNADRPLLGSDIRQLHELLMVGDSRRGEYKRYSNEIGGSSHVPPSPMDARIQMGEMTEWARSNTLPPLWAAAVIHAWLAHIHPFHDGNGRIARLLANLVLIRGGLPPLIVRASSDRERYIDALAASDHGGNILPLARVFRRVVARAAVDMESPDFAVRLFQAEVAARIGPFFARWSRAHEEFLQALGAELLLRRLTFERVGTVADADFQRLVKRKSGNIWVAKVIRPGYRQDLLLHVAWPTTTSSRLLEKDEESPSIFVSVRNQRSLDARQYFPVGREGFAYEFTPVVDTGTVLVRARSDSRRFRTAEAAQVAASNIERVARQLIVS